MYVYPSIEKTEVGGSVVVIENQNSMAERYTQHHVERKVYHNCPINADAAITYFKTSETIDRTAKLNTYSIQFRFLKTDGTYVLSWTYTREQTRDIDYDNLKKTLGKTDGNI